MNLAYLIEQWEALGLLLIGISVNQLRATPTGTTFGFPEATGAYIYTLFFVSASLNPLLSHLVAYYFKRLKML